MFLYNYSTRQLHGIWESTTKGEWMLNPAGEPREPCRQHLSCSCLSALSLIAGLLKL